MNQVELIEALTAKGYSAGFAGTMLVVTVNNRTDVPGVVQTKVKYSCLLNFAMATLNRYITAVFLP